MLQLASPAGCQAWGGGSGLGGSCSLLARVWAGCCLRAASCCLLIAADVGLQEEQATNLGGWLWERVLEGVAGATIAGTAGPAGRTFHHSQL